jgi:uncharacterized protein
MDKDLERFLTLGAIAPASCPASAIRCETVFVTMRDGVRLATDVYLPPVRPAPAIAMRTPYGRGADALVGTFMSFTRRGYVVIAQDCRGTGQSEPDHWDYYVHESEDGYDFVEWVTRQEWFNGFLGSCGGSYGGQTQWCMAMHPSMSTIVPEVSGLGVVVNSAHIYMGLDAYARTVGKGAGKLPVSPATLEATLLPETLAGGYFNDPLDVPIPSAVLATHIELEHLPSREAKHRLWKEYCTLTAAQRGEFIKNALGTEVISILDVEHLSRVFGHEISHDAHALPFADVRELCRSLNAPALFHTGWYDWGLNDALATWDLVRREARSSVAARSRLIIAPSAHSAPGYYEGIGKHPELRHAHRTHNHPGLLLHWYSAIRAGNAEAWPRVIYYLMGANEWRATTDWPPPETRSVALYFNTEGGLTTSPPDQDSQFDQYTYDPEDPTPTVGGAIVSAVYHAGSVDVSEVQRRADIVTYTTPSLERDIDVVGPLRVILHASSSAIDTDFCVRLSDVFPDGRALQIQSALIRARYRQAGAPQWLSPNDIHEFDIDLWATANRFKAGHRIRIDVSSADFPRFDRNSNLGGRAGKSVSAQQTIHRSRHYPSHASLSMIGAPVFSGSR